MEEKVDVEEAHRSGWKNIPGFARFVMVAQTIIILFFSYWAVSEYNNNYYFQAYVNNVFQGSGGSAVILGTVGVFGLVSLVLFAKLHRTRKELGEITSMEAKGQIAAGYGKQHGGILDDATEKHLIEMIRRKASPETPAQSTPENAVSGSAPQATPVPATSIVGSPLPVLKRVDNSGREH